MINARNTWVYGLDSIRFMLATVVLIGHSGFIPDYELGSDPSIIAMAVKLTLANTFVGIAAVIGFFVISGFVIHFPYRNGKPLHVSEFYSKRLLRIVLPLLVMFLLCWMFRLKVPFVVWSLYCEIIYYLFYPLLYRHLISKPKNVDILIVGSIMLALLAIGWFTNDFNVLLQHKVKETANFHTPNHLLNWIFGFPAWLMGVRIAVHFDKIANSDTAFKKVILLRVLVWLVAMTCSVLRFHFAVSYKITFIPAFSYLCYVWMATEISYYTAHRPIKWLENGGKWSYSIYLFHMIFVDLYLHWIQPESVFAHILKLIVVLVFCYVMYLLVERPSHQLIKRIKLR